MKKLFGKISKASNFITRIKESAKSSSVPSTDQLSFSNEFDGTNVNLFVNLFEEIVKRKQRFTEEKFVFLPVDQCEHAMLSFKHVSVFFLSSSEFIIYLYIYFFFVCMALGITLRT
jgi:hypothetical protein